jgi:O-antigen biosynthesis protein
MALLYSKGTHADVTPVDRPHVAGKFIQVGDRKLYIRGVTYGTFRPDSDGHEFHDPDQVERDFAQMAENGINAVRTYTVPPRWLLDIAQRHSLYVMVGLPWEQHIAFLDDKHRADDIEEGVRASVRLCAGHPAILFYAVGNEIPTSIARWHGARRIERFIHRLYRAVKAEDPGGLVTYVNYPSTEYLDLRFLDLVCFNVYLETQDRLEAYLARLHNVAHDRPLVLAEVGLDSRRNGEERQAEVLDWQIRTAFDSGCAGMFLFAWTDEWFRGSFDIEDWDFGLTDRQRRPKLALQVVRRSFSEVPFPSDRQWPRISVVVCSYNGARTIDDCCAGLAQLDYPDFEVIVVDDGSTDDTSAIARHYNFRVITTPNRGLSSARNTGMQAATGEIVAYTDDDARPDPHWLRYLAQTFMTTPHVGVGGPNIAPPGDGWIADCVANAPGGPVHVLISDHVAEHIPGCNMAFRKEALETVGGFDPRFRVAGDDVDLCWRLQEQGWTIGFSPSATVWHHRRNSLRMYWRQQRGYGKAEALLEQKWPERYNVAGHVSWGGRLYGKGLNLPLPLKRKRVYQGPWGTAPFQSVYEPAPGWLASLPMMPEWYLLVGVVAAITCLGLLWHPLLVSVPLLLAGLAAPLLQALIGGKHAQFVNPPESHRHEFGLRMLTAYLHFIQPMARLWGRLHSGLTPWRHRGNGTLLWPRARAFITWRAYILSSEGWLDSLSRALRDLGAVVRLGGDYDRWDLEVRGGALGETRLRLVIEEHGASKQLIRFRVWPRMSRLAVAAVGLISVLACEAWLDGGHLAAAFIAIGALLVMLRTLWECAASMATASVPFEHGGMETDVPFVWDDTPSLGRAETGKPLLLELPISDSRRQKPATVRSEIKRQE